MLEGEKFGLNGLFGGVLTFWNVGKRLIDRDVQYDENV